MTTYRQVERLVAGQPTSDGAGVRLTRLLTQDLQRRLDPFLMLDLFGSDKPGDYIAGFPDHPHRGFETVTLMIEGRMRHRDSNGNEGLLQGGGVQWMTAGRGVIHSEMPEQAEGRMEGFQLWLNLAGTDKMQPGSYRDIADAEIPRLTLPGVIARVVAGSSHGVAGAVQRPRTEPLIVDLALEPGASFEQPLPAAHHAFVVPYRGSLTIAGRAVQRAQLALLGNDGEAVQLSAGAEGAKAILVAGAPLNEPIVQYGPFVMNTRDQIIEAVQDFQQGRLA
jgi:hypothetical protein